jgi:hypothetical protein
MVDDGRAWLGMVREVNGTGGMAWDGIWMLW